MFSEGGRVGVEEKFGKSRLREKQEARLCFNHLQERICMGESRLTILATLERRRVWGGKVLKGQNETNLIRRKRRRELGLGGGHEGGTPLA